MDFLPMGRVACSGEFKIIGKEAVRQFELMESDLGLLQKVNSRLAGTLTVLAAAPIDKEFRDLANTALDDGLAMGRARRESMGHLFDPSNDDEDPLLFGSQETAEQKSRAQLIVDLKVAHHEAMIAWHNYAQSGWTDQKELERYDAKFAIVSRIMSELPSPLFRPLRLDEPC